MLRARTWVDVDLDAVAQNLRTVRAEVGPGIGVMAVVKADAYGHGAVPIAWRLVAEGVDALGVGDSSEALALREAGIRAPIVVLGAIIEGELPDVLRGNIEITVHARDRVARLREVLARGGARVGVHLKVDTGMGRLGCHPERAPAIAREIVADPSLSLVGVATHLATVDDGDNTVAHAQLDRFDGVIASLAAAGIQPTWRHAHASSGVFARLRRSCNLVRPGLGLYGVHPHGPAASPLRPILAWRTQIVFLKDQPEGACVGYEGTWRAKRPVRIATLPVGYNDGYRFAFSNRAEVLVRGMRCPVVGRVSMDYVTIDVTHVPGAAVDDVVTLLGRDGGEEIGVETLARWGDTIVHDIFCGIGERVRRNYTGSSAR